jgi:hypothetical protein
VAGPPSRVHSTDACEVGPCTLITYPVDLFVADHSRDSVDASIVIPWWQWLDKCAESECPTIVLQIWRPDSPLPANGPTAKESRKRFYHWGYQMRFVHVSNLACGGGVCQDRLLVYSFLLTQVPGQVVAAWTFEFPPNLPVRPMCNNLQPYGAGRYEIAAPTYLDASMVIPSSFSDPTPACSGSWIQTEKGFRRLFPDELGKGLGIPSSWWGSRSHRVSPSLVNSLVSAHIWEVVGKSLLDVLDLCCTLRRFRGLFAHTRAAG